MASTTAQPVPTTTTTTTAAPSTTIPNETPNPNPVTANSHISSSTSSTITTHNLASNSSSSFNPKKRALDHVGLLQSSPYFKIRVLLKEVRPLFLQVLRSADIQNCEAGRGIQGKMKNMIDLCKQKTVTENVLLVKCNNGAGGQDLTGGQKPAIKPFDQPSQGDRSFIRPTGNNLEKQTHEVNKIPGTYIVGGSAFGWNFITFHGTKPEYYGRTKEAFRAAM